ncbi:hypothetical protein T09_15655 [Trichinella sp. T9]|nr:hypothetical protein T09_15655 [Trichinella sp. T9]
MTITKIAIFSNHSCYGSAIKQIESLLKIITFPTDHCDDNFLRPQKSPNYLSIPAAVKLLNDERQLRIDIREILGAGAVYLHYLNRSRKQYILYEIACIHHGLLKLSKICAQFVNFNFHTSCKLFSNTNPHLEQLKNQIDQHWALFANFPCSLQDSSTLTDGGAFDKFGFTWIL